MQLPDHKYESTNKTYIKDSKVRIINTLNGEDLQSILVINRTRTYYNLPKIVCIGETQQGQPVREVTNVTSQGQETLVEIG